MTQSRVRPRLGYGKPLISRPASAPPCASEQYNPENNNPEDEHEIGVRKLVTQSASPYVMKRSDDTPITPNNQMSQLTSDILRSIEANQQLKDVNIDPQFLNKLIDQTFRHVLAESKEVLSWIPMGNTDASQSEIPITIIHYKQQLFGTMRDAGLKAHNIRLLDDQRYFNGRAVHVQDLKSKPGHISSRYLNDVNRRNNDLPFNNCKVIIPQCVFSDSNYTPDELKGLLLSYLEQGVSKIQIYIGRNADGEAGELKKEKWFKENAWLNEFIKVHPIVSFYTRDQLTQTSAYLTANQVFDAQLLNSSDIKKALQDDVVKHICRRLKKGKSSLLVPKVKSLPNSPVVLPLPENASAAAEIAEIPKLERQPSDGNSDQMVSRVSSIVKVPELRKMVEEQPEAMGRFWASLFHNADALKKNHQKNPKSPPVADRSPLDTPTIKVRA